MYRSFKVTRKYTAEAHARNGLEHRLVVASLRYVLLKLDTVRLQSPIERVQKQQELFQDDVTKMKTRLKTLQTRTVRLEAMMKALLGHHGIKLKPEIDEDDAELKWDSSDDEVRYAG